MTAFWKERNMPDQLGLMIEIPWSSKDKTYMDAYNVHWNNIFGYIKNIENYFVKY